MNDNNERGAMERAGSAVGGLAGAAGDAAISVMNSMLGTVARTVGGWWSDRKPDDAISGFDESADNSCRTHFQNTRRNNSTTYESVRPLYQFGHLAGQNPDYQGRSFEEVEPGLRNAWSADATTRQYGDWSSVRDYVSAGYTTRT